MYKNNLAIKMVFIMKTLYYIIWKPYTILHEA